MILWRYKALAVGFPKHPHVIPRSCLFHIHQYTLCFAFLDHLRATAGVFILRGSSCHPPLHLIVSICLIIDGFGEIVQFL
jgi:hypothetical protein